MEEWMKEQSREVVCRWVTQNGPKAKMSIYHVQFLSERIHPRGNAQKSG